MMVENPIAGGEVQFRANCARPRLGSRVLAHRSQKTTMNAHPVDLGFLAFPLVLLAACVVSVPIARRLRLSAIVAYLAAGVIIGPWGLGVVHAPETILAVAELGVVLMLFL